FRCLANVARGCECNSINNEALAGPLPLSQTPFFTMATHARLQGALPEETVDTQCRRAQTRRKQEKPNKLGFHFVLAACGVGSVGNSEFSSPSPPQSAGVRFDLHANNPLPTTLHSRFIVCPR
uniref:Integron gene cassette protein n=1 Tax=Mesocestoides corti TaxID=53468 RepID=A0A5K3ET55_MESCO